MIRQTLAGGTGVGLQPRIDDSEASELVDLMPSTEFESLVESITASVLGRVGGVKRWEVERVVVEEVLRLREGRVAAYLPIRAERAAVERLSRARGGRQ